VQLRFPGCLLSEAQSGLSGPLNADQDNDARPAPNRAAFLPSASARRENRLRLPVPERNAQMQALSVR